MAHALICGSCTSMSCYAEDDIWDAIWTKHLKDSMPISCKECGTGEYKIASSIDPAKWCNECSKHKSRCKCSQKEEAVIKPFEKADY